MFDQISLEIYLTKHTKLFAGDRNERTISALSTIGSAVFNGGLTTFLALVLLGLSTSHVFISFFKVFCLTVMFGLYHGLVLLPVLLAILGPDSAPSPAAEPSPANYGSSRGRDNRVFTQEEVHKGQGVWT